MLFSIFSVSFSVFCFRTWFDHLSLNSHFKLFRRHDNECAVTFTLPDNYYGKLRANHIRTSYLSAVFRLTRLPPLVAKNRNIRSPFYHPQQFRRKKFQSQPSAAKPSFQSSFRSKMLLQVCILLVFGSILIIFLYTCLVQLRDAFFRMQKQSNGYSSQYELENVLTVESTTPEIIPVLIFESQPQQEEIEISIMPPAMVSSVSPLSSPPDYVSVCGSYISTTSSSSTSSSLSSSSLPDYDQLCPYQDSFQAFSTSSYSTNLACNIDECPRCRPIDLPRFNRLPGTAIRLTDDQEDRLSDDESNLNEHIAQQQPLYAQPQSSFPHPYRVRRGNYRRIPNHILEQYMTNVRCAEQQWYECTSARYYKPELDTPPSYYEVCPAKHTADIK